MKSNSKRIKNLKTLISNPIYSIDEGLLLIMKLRTAMFLESIELHISLNINPRNAKQQVTSDVLLPNVIKKNKRIAVFTDEINNDLIGLGACIVGNEEILTKIRSGNIDFDILITNQKNMPKLSSVGRILGIKGLMPSLKNGTVTNDFESTIDEFSNGKINYKTDKHGVIHLVFGKDSFSMIELKQNLLTVIESVKKNKPLGIKGKYFKSLYICTSMSPSIKLFNY